MAGTAAGIVGTGFAPEEGTGGVWAKVRAAAPDSSKKESDFTRVFYLTGYKSTRPLYSLYAEMMEQYRGAESVLIAKDEPLLKTLAKLILCNFGYSILAATNEQEAIQVHRSAGPFGLLLTDVVMPVMTGPELAHQLKQETVHPGNADTLDVISA